MKSRRIDTLACDPQTRGFVIKQRVNLKVGQLEDSKGLFRDMTGVGHWGLGDYEAKYGAEVDIDYLMSLVKQSYQYHLHAE